VNTLGSGVILQIILEMSVMGIIICSGLTVHIGLGYIYNQCLKCTRTEFLGLGKLLVTIEWPPVSQKILARKAVKLNL